MAKDRGTICRGGGQKAKYRVIETNHGFVAQYRTWFGNWRDKWHKHEGGGRVYYPSLSEAIDSLKLKPKSEPKAVWYSPGEP